jgi:YfiR/HmsC-like
MSFVFKCCGLVMAVLIWLSCGVVSRSQAKDASGYDVKATFLCNLGKFVDWPTGTYAYTNAPMLIGIYGKNPFNGELVDAAQDLEINGHEVVVRPVSFNELPECQVLFICPSEKKNMNAILRKLDHAAVLTVTENQDPFRTGAMINFATENDQIHVEINNAAAERAGLKLSSKLLMLAPKTDPQSTAKP